MRFVSSGTEACMSAIRLARGFTGRNFIIKFEGCYHGHADACWSRPLGRCDLRIPGSAGVPAETAQHTLALPYNNLAAVEAAFAAHPSQIACILVEPVVGNAGTIPPAPGYLAGLRRIATEQGALADSGRGDDGLPALARRRAAALRRHSRPHHAGQVLGGGLPCGTFGGRADVMNLLARWARSPGRNAQRQSAGIGAGIATITTS